MMRKLLNDNNEEKSKEYFERFKKRLNPRNQLHNFERRWKKMSDYRKGIHPNENLRILEIAAGEGHNAKLIESKALSKPFMIDYAFASCQRAKEVLGPDSYILRADACTLPFQDNSFDIVFGNAFLHHIDNQKAVIEEAVRVAKDGGCICFFEPNRFNPLLLMFALLHYSVEKGVLTLNPNLLCEYLINTGRVDNVTIVPHTTFLFPYQKFPPQILYGLFSKLESLLEYPYLCTNYAIFARRKESK